VTIVTVLYNSSEVLEEFLESARAATERLDADVVIVDNASEDEATSRQIAERFGATFVSAGSNRGYGAGVNLGERMAPEARPLLLISNPDVRFHADALDRLIEYARTMPVDVAALGPRILEVDGTVYPSARRLPSLGTGIGHALFGRLFPSNPWTRRYRAESDYTDEARSAEWLSGACLLMDSAWFRRVGGFDERYFMYFEDVDLGARIRQAGGRSVYVPSATVVHSGAHSTSRSATAMVRAHHASAERYLSIRYAGVFRAPLRWLLVGALRVRSAMEERRGR
jgi:N-acetylglucosaminyl-diphospho-decaprenol L-rhamnosyltransferase